ncbi:MAG TPA: FAD-dependent oxidoreductase [Candidatus Sulfomarinibacteraceae bacterium]|nr:FAD-dependent oxidoreductase [Candidatus Sulfomarinibacteraceae bacterium]
MSEVGTETSPLRVAIIGAGPTGFYTADQLFKQKQYHVEVDMYERLPTPFGLVRYGVAPDHQKIKSVTKVFDRTARKPNFRFYGNVDLGRDISLADLRRHYHQIVFTTGAQTDRSLGIPGEELRGSHAATEFVAWYNGHPDFRDCHFDLSGERAAVIGVGNVAVDVCRILSRTPEELGRTDIADYALEALRESNIKEVYMLGRRGPAQAAFTTPEVKELGEMEDADCYVPPDEARLDPLSEAAVAESADRATARKVEIIQQFAEEPPNPKSRTLILRFLVSPTELIGDDEGNVTAMKLVKNELYQTEAGTLRPRSTDEYETLPCDIVFRSIGYTGVPLPGVPFKESWGVILNEAGRVIDPDSGEPIPGEYTAGWIKRGATGVIGTNKPDAAETVEAMIEDVAAGSYLRPTAPDAEAARATVENKQPRYFSYEDWLELDEIEVQRGKEQGRPRVKFTSVEEMLEALDKS